MIKLDKKYVFHIPKYKIWKLKINSCPHRRYNKEFITKLNENGYTSAYLTEAKSYYKNRTYDEILITLFTSSKNNPEKIFRKFFTENNSILKQEAFAYECDNRMFIEELKK